MTIKFALRRRYWVALAIALSALFTLLWGFQDSLATALLKRTLDGRAGLDITTGLPDGLHIAFCGSGAAMPDPTRAGPCSVIIAGQRVFVVDTGEGGARNMALMGVPMARIERVFLTHFHSDHIDGLGQVMMLRWTGGPATSPLPVAGPIGVEAVVNGFNGAYSADNRYRTAHHGVQLAPPSGAGAIAAPFAFRTATLGGREVVFNQHGLKVTAFKVNHDPVAPAVGYRFDYKGRSIVISGDTTPTVSLVSAARRADLLVHEALQPKLVALMTDALERQGIRNTAQLTRDIHDYHSSPEQAAAAARAAGVKEIVLNHVVPPIPFRFAHGAYLGGAKNYFDGRITVGEDGMMFSLPVASDAITRKHLL